MSSGLIALPVRTSPVEDPGDLLALLPRGPSLCWLRGGDGMVGWGEAARLELRGPDRFRRAARWLAGVGQQFAPHGGAPGAPGGVVAFGSFGFDDTDPSVLIVPAVLVGRIAGRSWTTWVGEPPRRSKPGRARPPAGLSYQGEDLAARAFSSAVATALEGIGASTVDKVVVAGSVNARADAPLDARWLLQRLAAGYPDCWTFAVDGLVGASPELLVRVAGEAVSSRVLAGSAAPDADPSELAGSAKDLAEHQFAVRSVLDGLSGACVDLTATPQPYLLEFANLRHLATDVSGRLAHPVTALELAGQLHPTAAVAGVPTSAALALIRTLEGEPRGRYAAPVGWVSADGDGEWCIALRCAELSGAQARLYAGCGIVRGSEPEREVAEWRTKLRPAKEALGLSG